MTSLALSDFLKAVAAPLRIILTLTRFIGNYGCKLLVFLNTISTTASAITLLSVSIDRFIIVKWPLHQRPHRLNIIYIIAFIWLAAGCLGSVYLVKDHITYYSKYFMCSSNMKKQISVGLTIGIFTIQTLVPITLFTIMYFLIIFELKKTAKNKALLDSHRVIAIRLQQNSKTIKMVVFAVVIFYVCILPSNIYYLWYEFNQNALLIETASTIYDILILLEICSSIGNPVVKLFSIDIVAERSCHSTNNYHECCSLNGGKLLLKDNLRNKNGFLYELQLSCNVCMFFTNFDISSLSLKPIITSLEKPVATVKLNAIVALREFGKCHKSSRTFASFINMPPSFVQRQVLLVAV
nr:neuropeptide CCHamide-2 receptor-like [Hydra vulgaris]